MVFVSYSRKDFSLVHEIIDKLKAKGIQLFIDSETLSNGEDFAVKIIKQIKESDFILFFYSTYSSESVWVRREIEFALSNNKTIIPVLLPSAVENEWFIEKFGDKNRFTIDLERLDRCVEDIANYINPPLLQEKFEREDENGEFAYSINKNLEVNSSILGRGFRRGGHCLILLFIILFLGGIGFVWLFDSDNEYFDNSDSVIVYEDVNIHDDIYGDACACDSVAVTQEENIDDNVAIGDSVYEGVCVTDSFIVDPNTADDEDLFPSNELGKENTKQTIVLVNKLEGGNTIWIFIPVIVLSFLLGNVTMYLIIRKKRNKRNLKLSSNIDSSVSVDGKFESDLKAREVYSMHLAKGEYLIDFKSKNEENMHMTFNHTVNTNYSKLLYAEFDDEKYRTIKCFIAGSTALQVERDSLRSVISIMYNKWANKRFRILAYTFEDFERTAVVGGHQQKYDNFIKEEANWALFIIDGRVGGITVGEYRKAMDTYKEKGSPQILVLARKGSMSDDKVLEIKQEIDREKQYWADYENINEMKYIFESTLNWDLVNMFHN